MIIRIDIDGLEILKRQLREIQEGLTLPVVKKWAERIEDETNLRLGSIQKRLVNFKVTELEPGKIDVLVNADKQAFPVVLDTIERFLGLMPITTRALFQNILDRLREKGQ